MLPQAKLIAFLRAINVGGHTVKMDRLRELFQALELAHVETFIASGNVIFEASDVSAQQLEEQIERHLQQSLGYAVTTFIRSTIELADIAKYKPFTAAQLAAEGSSLYIAFLRSTPASAAQQKIMALQTEFDAFHIYQREFYWLSQRSISTSTFSGALLEKTLGMPATMRNVTTVRKLAAKYPAD